MVKIEISAMTAEEAIAELKMLAALHAAEAPLPVAPVKPVVKAEKPVAAPVEKPVAAPAPAPVEKPVEATPRAVSEVEMVTAFKALVEHFGGDVGRAKAAVQNEFQQSMKEISASNDPALKLRALNFLTKLAAS